MLTTIMLFVSIVVFIGCQKDSTLTIKPQAKKISFAVSFKKNLVPLFTKYCAVAGCHVGGGQAPDLTASKAFGAITSPSAGMISLSDPQSSKLYGYLTGKLTPAMPMGKSSNPEDLNDLFLAWITQGAKNN